MSPLRNALLLCAAAAASALLAACGSAPAARTAGADSGDVLAPNENLLTQNVPAIPTALVRQVDKYTDFRGHGFVDWHPLRAEMLVAHRGAGASTAQLFRLKGPLAEPEQLTAYADPVSKASYEPLEGRYLVFARASGGNEADQLHRLDLDSKTATLLTDPDQRHAAVAWLHQRSQLIYTSVPLDRTAEGGSRSAPSTTLWIVDPLRPAETRRKIADLPGTGWFNGAVSWDDTRLAITNFRSINESQVWEVTLADGKARQLLPAAGEAVKGVHQPVGYRKDGRGLFIISDRASEFRELMLAVEGAGLRRMTAAIPWDVQDAELSDDGSRLAVRLNVDGREELKLIDTLTFAEYELPPLPAGSVNTARVHRDGKRLAVGIDSVRAPNRLYTVDLDDGAAAKPQAWTTPYIPAGADLAGLPDQRIVRWKAADGLALSGILSMPPARFTGKRPVIVSIHGGPEGQATLGFRGRWTYMLNEQGIAVIEPNVRGSTGYGKTFLTLDNGLKREDSVKDIGSLLDWLATQPEFDASRVLVTGGSYGGYMTLATSVHYADRIAGAIDVVGISNFVTFLTNTESYRRDLRRVEYGDERDPAMREFLERISPLNNAQKITKPLFVVQGKNDPRVPYTEAEQIVDRVRRNGAPVWYLRAENEGHGFARKENADYQFYATIRFLEQTLLKRQ